MWLLHAFMSYVCDLAIVLFVSLPVTYVILCFSVCVCSWFWQAT